MTSNWAAVAQNADSLEQARRAFNQHNTDSGNLDVLERCKRLNEFLTQDFLRKPGQGPNSKAGLQQILALLSSRPKRPACLDKPPITHSAGKAAPAKPSPPKHASHNPPGTASLEVFDADRLLGALDLEDEGSRGSTRLTSASSFGRTVTPSSSNHSSCCPNPTPGGSHPEDVDDLIGLLNVDAQPCQQRTWQGSKGSSDSALQQNLQEQERRAREQRDSERRQQEAEELHRQQQKLQREEAERQLQQQREEEQRRQRQVQQQKEEAEQQRQAQQRLKEQEQQQRREEQLRQQRQEEERQRELQLQREREQQKRAEQQQQEEQRKREIAQREQELKQRQEEEQQSLQQLAEERRCQEQVQQQAEEQQRQRQLQQQAEERQRQEELQEQQLAAAACQLQAAVRALFARRALARLRTLHTIRCSCAARTIQTAWRAWASIPENIWKLGPVRAASAALNHRCPRPVSAVPDALLAQPVRLRAPGDARSAPQQEGVSSREAHASRHTHRTVSGVLARSSSVRRDEAQQRGDVATRAAMAASKHRDTAAAIEAARRGSLKR